MQPPPGGGGVQRNIGYNSTQGSVPTAAVLILENGLRIVCPGKA